MILYRAAIAPEGPLVSPLQSDTLFGAFCWSWLRCFGEQSLKDDILCPARNGEPPVIFSNGFPDGGLPLPMGCYDMGNQFEKITGKQERRAAYQRNKKLKGARFVSRSSFDRIRAGDWRGFADELMEEGGREDTTIHNMVSRDSGTVENLDGAGNLFGSDRRFFHPSQRFDCYVLTSLEQKRLSVVLELMLSLGIGADTSTAAASSAWNPWKRTGSCWSRRKTPMGLLPCPTLFRHILTQQRDFIKPWPSTPSWTGSLP